MGSNGNIKKQTCHEHVQHDNDQVDSSTQAKKQRKRTKKLISQLKNQIEFYFSNSNLQKDRFLKQEIIKNKDGYVPIKTIADFNRMKQMTTDIGLVVKAIKASALLKMNDEETMVKRKDPLPEAKNVDAETIYVENLPPHADHDWLRKIFSQFGKVAYVSIPRFKQTCDIKGFAFIEFENANEANNAVKAFQKETEEKESNETEEPKVKRRKRSHSESDVENSKQNDKTERKRRRTTSESSADSQEGNLDSPKKKQRLVLPDIQPKIKEESNKTLENVDEEKCRKRKKNDKSVHWEQQDDTKEKKSKTTETKETEEEMPNKKPKSSLSDSNTENEEKEEAEKKATKKKRKRKVKEKKEAKLPHFRVIPKLEWMHLKQEYKKLQRESMQELKKQLQVNAGKQEDEEQKQSTNQSNQPAQKKKEEKKEECTVKELPFTPGVVLQFKCLDGTDLPKSEIRARLTTHAPLAYVDVKEGNGEGYIRFHTADNCTKVLDNVDSSSGLKLDKLTGEVEREYWRKINADRLERFQAKRQKKRGTEKVARKVDAIQVNQKVTHIRFDEE